MAEQSVSTEEASTNGAAELEYGGYYFRHDCGVPYERNEYWLEFFDRIADGIVRDLGPATVLDAGCAMGFLVEALRKRGLEAFGLDISEYAIERVDESVREFCSVGSLVQPLPEGRRYDLITCIEVLEHLPPEDTDRAIANLCAATDRILLSTTPDDYAEATHLNVQPPEAWSAALAREGFLREVDRDFSYITPWAALYVRREEPLVETVRRYDGSWWRLRRESGQVRAALLSAQEKLAELEQQREEDRPEMQRELDGREEEILRLRDLLVGRDAELGAALGRATALEAQGHRLRALLARAERMLRIPLRILAALRPGRGQS